MSSQRLSEIVLVGGGHTHALVLNALKKEPLENTRVTVINPETHAPYSGMLPGFVAGHYSREELDIDLQSLSERVGAELVVGKAVSIDLQGKIVQLEDQRKISYDLSSIDIGITSRMHALRGFSEYAVPAKPLGVFSSQWDCFRNSDKPKHVAVIGGGIAGAELSMAMAYALRSASTDFSVKLLDRGQILSDSSAKTQARVCAELLANDVELLETVDVVAVTPEGVNFANGSRLTANFVVGAAGATPHAWLKDTELKTHNGFIEVDNTLQSSDKSVFAVGDCAHMTFDPRPKAGVYAVRQAPLLLRNLRNAINQTALETYEPQSDYLKLVSLGGKRAFGEKSGFGLSGTLVWKLKNHIDKTFMNQFQL